MMGIALRIPKRELKAIIPSLSYQIKCATSHRLNPEKGVESDHTITSRLLGAVNPEKGVERGVRWGVKLWPNPLNPEKGVESLRPSATIVRDIH